MERVETLVWGEMYLNKVNENPCHQKTLKPINISTYKLVEWYKQFYMKWYISLDNDHKQQR